MKKEFGGGLYQGIEPCDDSKTVLIYTDHKSGKKRGYYDGWLPEIDDNGPIFEYTGTGKGNQTFDGNPGYRNGKIRDHSKTGYTLHVFKADGTEPGTNTKRQRYIGMFEIDEEEPYVDRLARNEDKEVRQVIVFRLRPVSQVEPLSEDTIPHLPKPEVIPVPASITKSSLAKPEKIKNKTTSKSGTPSTTITWHESSLSAKFEEFLLSHQREVLRFQIRTAGLSSSLWTDLYDANAHVLYEAKSTSSRESIRMAIGQLMDYRRNVEPKNPTLAVLLPSKPHPDLQDLLDSVGINIVYQYNGEFEGWPVNP